MSRRASKQLLRITSSVTEHSSSRTTTTPTSTTAAATSPGGSLTPPRSLRKSSSLDPVPTVVPSTSSYCCYSAPTAPAALNTSGQLVVEALLGDRLSLWNAPSVMSQSSRHNSDHLLNWATSCIALPVLTTAMNGRVVWTPESQKTVQSFFAPSVDNERVAQALQLLQTQKGTSAASWWLPTAFPSSHGTTAEWHTCLFSLLRSDELLQVADAHALSQLLHHVRARCQETFQRHHQTERHISSQDHALVPPVWCRSLRKICLEQLPVGSCIAFGDFFMELVRMEATYMPPAQRFLAQDDELMKFHASLPGRRESGLTRNPKEDHFDSEAMATQWQTTESYVQFSLGCSIAKVLREVGRAPSRPISFEPVKQILQVACNAASFIANDTRDGPRVLCMVQLALDELTRQLHAQEAAGVSLQAVFQKHAKLMAQFALQAADVAVASMLQKASVVRWSCVEGVTAVLRYRAHMASTLLTPSPSDTAAPQLGQKIEQLHRQQRRSTSLLQLPPPPVEAVDPVATLYLTDLLTHKVLPMVGETLSSPRRYDQVVLQSLFMGLFAEDNPLRDWRQCTAAYPALRAALCAAAPASSLAHTGTSPSSSTWQCGCGRSWPAEQRLCIACTIRSPTASSGYSCSHCNAFSNSIHPLRGTGCTSCGAEHPADMKEAQQAHSSSGSSMNTASLPPHLWLCRSCKKWMCQQAGNYSVKVSIISMSDCHCRCGEPHPCGEKKWAVNLDRLDDIERQLILAHRNSKSL